MNTRAIRPIHFVLAITMTFFVAFSLLTIPPCKVLHGKLLKTVKNKATSGVSGNVFSGERVRNFTKRLENPRTNSLNTTSTCSRWAVVTTIHAPTVSIHKVVNQSEFCVVIVADRKTPTKEYIAFWSATKRVHFLSVEKQQGMQDMAITDELPWNHFGRKNLGYLYAIQHGANVVFDFDDDNELISDVPSIGHPTLKPWLVADNTEVFNPYPTFINLDDVAWPRGFPLTQIQNVSTWKKPGFITNNASIGVVQSLANHDPDMDAIWRLTRKLPLNFDEGKRVVLQPGTYSSYNAQATLHYALWGMLLPVSVHGRVSDIWRSYIMQRLMHEVGQVVGFISPFVKQVRNAHNYQGDYMSERPLYEKTEALVQVLSEWKGKSVVFEDRFVELFVELYERDFIEIKDVHLAQKWIRTLQQMRYVFPHLKKEGLKTHLKKEASLSTLVAPKIEKNEKVCTTGGVDAYLAEKWLHHLAEKWIQTVRQQNEKVCITGGVDAYLAQKSVQTLQQQPIQQSQLQQVNKTSDNQQRGRSSDFRKNEKVAVCITGGVRDATKKRLKSIMSYFGWVMSQLSPAQQKTFHNWVERTDPFPVDTIHQYLYPSFKDFDVFMLLNPPDHNISCSAYEPRNNIRSRLFCNKVEFENPTQQQLNMSNATWDFAKLHFYPQSANYFEGHFLGQLWDYSRCESMIEKEEKRSNMKYDIIVRLRPDTLFVVPMPEISLRTTRKGILDIRGFGSGGEDIFNVGRRKEMGRFMNRVYDINKIFLDRRFVNAVGLGRYTAETYSVFWWWWENYARDSKKYENLNKAPITGTQYFKENIYMWPHIYKYPWGIRSNKARFDDGGGKFYFHVYHYSEFRL